MAPKNWFSVLASLPCLYRKAVAGSSEHFVPKSGTHLLDQILLASRRSHRFSSTASFYAEYEGESGLKHTPEQAVAC